MLNEGQLCNKLEKYCKDNNLPFMSAEELLSELNYDGEHVEWLLSFIEEWDALMDK